MRIITTKTKAYKLDELSSESREKALSKQAEFNTSDLFWSESVIEDAENISLSIPEWDIYRGTIKGKFTEDAETVAKNIKADHGKHCETYKTAQAFLSDLRKLNGQFPKDRKTGDREYAYEGERETLENKFLRSLSEDYLSMLKKEYEYSISEERCIEDIEANNYEFTEDGEMI